MQPEIKVKVGADTAEFDTAMARVRKGLVLFAGAATAAMAGLAATVKTQLDFADDMVKMAAKFGVPVETLTALKHAADLSGVSIENLGVSLGYLSRTMVDTPEKLQALGIAATDAAGNMRPTEDVLADLADLFSRMPDGALKTATAYDILGRSSIQLIPLLNGGAQALRDMMEEARALGIVIDEETARSAEAFNDNLSRLGAAVKGVSIQLTAALAPALEDASNALIDFVKEYEPVEKLKGILDRIADAWYTMIDVVVVVNTAVREVASRIKSAFEGIQYSVLTAANFIRLKMQEAFDKILEVAVDRLRQLASVWNMIVGKLPGIGEPIDVELIGADVLKTSKDELKVLEGYLRLSSGAMRESFENAFEPLDLLKWPTIRARDLFGGMTGGGTTGGGTTGDGTTGDGDGNGKPNLPGLPSPDDIKELDYALTDLGRSAEQAFTQFLTGAKSAREALKGLLDSMASAASNELFRMLFGSFKTLFTPPGATPSAPVPPLSWGGSPSSAPALSMPSVGRASGPASGGMVRIVVEEAPGFASRVRTEAQGVAVRVTQAGIREYDRMSLPQSVRRINGQPRMIGA